MAFLFLGISMFQTNSYTISKEDREKLLGLSTNEIINDYNYQNKRGKEIDDFLKTLVVNWKTRETMADRFSLENREKITQICQKHGIFKEEYLYEVIYWESRGDTRARNKFSHATGIIGWLPSTAKQLGTSVEEIFEMSMDQQLDLLDKYFSIGGRCKQYKTCSTLYLAIFYPAAIGKPKDYVLGDTTTIHKRKVLKGNKKFDINNDDVITVSEFIQYNSIAKI